MIEEEVKAVLREASAKIKEDFIPAMTNLLMDVFQHGINKGTEIGLKIGTNAPQPNNHCSIQWQTGEPKESGLYLVTISGKYSIFVQCMQFGCLTGWSYFKPEEIIAWCKLNDIKPYKEGTK